MPPYNDVANWDMVNYLRAGRRLGKPEHCPASMFELMNCCWQWFPHDRPTFTEILNEINARVAQIEQRKIQKTVARNQAYVNVARGPYYNPDNDTNKDELQESKSSGFFSGGTQNSSSTSPINYTSPDLPTTDL